MKTTDTIKNAAFAIDGAAENLNAVVNMLDAVTAIFRPLTEGDANMGQVEDMWRMSDSIINAARVQLTSAADTVVASACELMDASRAIGA